jgi:hypothetical protein
MSELLPVESAGDEGIRRHGPHVKRGRHEEEFVQPDQFAASFASSDSAADYLVAPGTPSPYDVTIPGLVRKAVFFLKGVR